MSQNDVRTFGLNIICAAAMLMLTGSAWGTLNKCTGADGKVTYTEQRCEENQTKSSVKIKAAPPFEPQGSGLIKNAHLSPGQVALCDRARKTLESGKREIAQESNKNKADLLASTRQEMSNLDQLIREQCN